MKQLRDARADAKQPDKAANDVTRPAGSWENAKPTGKPEAKPAVKAKVSAR